MYALYHKLAFLQLIPRSSGDCTYTFSCRRKCNLKILWNTFLQISDDKENLLQTSTPDKRAIAEFRVDEPLKIED